MSKAITKIRDNILPSEYRHLQNYLQADTTIRASRKDRLSKMFLFLHQFCIRVNEITQITNNMLIELLEQSQLKIVAHKQTKEKIIYLTKRGKKLIQAAFPNIEPNDDYIFRTERHNKPLTQPSVIRDINSYLKSVFPNKNILSHSFRSSIISELLNDKNISPSVVQQMAGHSSISTTFLYSKVTDQNIMNSLELVR